MSSQFYSFFSPNFKINKESYLFWMFKQGYTHHLNFVIIPYSVNIIEILKLTYKHGLISGFQISRSSIKVYLKWPLDGSSVFQKIKIFSKPSASHKLKFCDFIKCHLHSCAISPIWVFRTKSGYVDHYNLYKNKIGGDLIAIIT